jgi:hypothetical protein
MKPSALKKGKLYDVGGKTILILSIVKRDNPYYPGSKTYRVEFLDLYTNRRVITAYSEFDITMFREF